MFPRHKPCDYILHKYLRDCVYHTNPHTIQELPVETEAAAEETADSMLSNTVNIFVVYLQQVDGIEELLLNVCSCKDHLYTALHENGHLFMYHMLLSPRKLYIKHVSICCMFFQLPCIF
jgi:hypothetical protein